MLTITVCKPITFSVSARPARQLEVIPLENSVGGEHGRRVQRDDATGAVHRPAVQLLGTAGSRSTGSRSWRSTARHVLLLVRVPQLQRRHGGVRAVGQLGRVRARAVVHVEVVAVAEAPGVNLCWRKGQPRLSSTSVRERGKCIPVERYRMVADGDAADYPRATVQPAMSVSECSISAAELMVIRRTATMIVDRLANKNTTPSSVGPGFGGPFTAASRCDLTIICGCGEGGLTTWWVPDGGRAGCVPGSVDGDARSSR